MVVILMNIEVWGDTTWLLNNCHVYSVRPCSLLLLVLAILVETCMFLGAGDSNRAQVTLNDDNSHCSYVLRVIPT